MLACNHSRPVEGCPECERVGRSFACDGERCSICALIGRRPPAPAAPPLGPVCTATDDCVCRCGLVCTATDESDCVYRRVVPTPPALSRRVALGSPADAAALAVIRGLLADDRIRRSLEHDAREWSAACDGHEYRAAQHAEGSADRAAQDERGREARQHRDLYRAVLALHVPSVPGV